MKCVSTISRTKEYSWPNKKHVQRKNLLWSFDSPRPAIEYLDISAFWLKYDYFFNFQMDKDNKTNGSTNSAGSNTDKTNTTDSNKETLTGQTKKRLERPTSPFDLASARKKMNYSHIWCKIRICMKNKISKFVQLRPDYTYLSEPWQIAGVMKTANIVDISNVSF